MRREEGFTLLEVMVALSILGVALTVLFGVFANNLARSRETQSRLEARSQSRCEEASQQGGTHPIVVSINVNATDACRNIS